MVKKQIQGHDFLNGGPIKQYKINFADDLIAAHQGDVNTANIMIPIFDSRFELNDSNGDNIFLVNKDRVSWMDQNLVTEQRVLQLINQYISNSCNNSIH